MGAGARYRAGVSETVTTPRTALLERLMARFPHVPPEAVLKEDLLRTGIAFDASALTDNLDGTVTRVHVDEDGRIERLAPRGVSTHALPSAGAPL